MRKKTLILIFSIILGVIISLVFRLGLITVTKDFSYYKIFSWEKFDLNADVETNTLRSELIGWKYMGKEVFNLPYSGFPFPAYTDCSIQGKGDIYFSPSCNKVFLGDFATLLNIIIWSGLFYGLFFIINKVIKL